MVKEPQGVQELMEQTESAWRAEIAACDDASAPEREVLLEALGALRREYGEADYPRREAIQGDLRELIRRHDALTETAPEPVAEPESDPAPHAPVPLGVESALPSDPESRPGPTREAAPPRPARAARPEPVSGASRRPESAPRATGPVPHGYAGPGPQAGPEPATAAAEGRGGRQAHAAADPRSESTGNGMGDEGGDEAEPRTGWEGVWATARATARRWAALGRLMAEHEVLLGKRETRYAELGVRLGQLNRRDGLAGAAGDAGVRERLRQVEQVDAAIRANRDRWDDLRGPG